MRETVLSQSLRVMFACGMAGLLANQVQAQQADTPIQKIEVTGSSIKRLAAETAAPLTIIKAEEFIKQGLTTAQEVLNKLPSNQSNLGSGNAVGGNKSGLPTGGQAAADLRGLGANKTLVLLNGRRIANHPYDGSSVDLNVIPIAALDRVEVLRDGASSLYGTDAIGGVINFITKKSVTGATITVEGISPDKSGGKERRLNLVGGFGDLAKDGYNIFGVVDYHDQAVISSQDRDFSKTGVLPDRGLNLTSGTTFPGNYFDPTTGKAGNPGFATGCFQPFSVPRASNGTCRQDFTRQIDDLPPTRQSTFFGKGTFKLNADHTATVEVLHTDNFTQSRTAPPPQVGLTLPNTSKYYPGNSGGIPAQTGLSGNPLSVNYRPLEAGPRQINSNSMSDRLLVALEGNLSGWDYKTGINYATSKSAENFVGGYVNDATFAAGVANGIINPFGFQDAAGLAYLKSTALRGQVQDGKTTTTSWDFKASHDLFAMAGGSAAIALGTEFRHEKAVFNVNQAIASQSSSSGLSGSLPTQGSRNIKAVFAEMAFPFTKQLEATLAARYDDYSDAGTTFNPKAGVRFQPSKQVLFRAQASKGFRAPSLFEKNGPASKNDTNDSYSDPILCPGGVLANNPIANPLRDCDLQQFKLQSGNKNLSPEKSVTYGFGVVLEPTPQVTLSLDYWNIELKDKIDYLPEQTIYGNFAKYRDRFLRNPDGTPFAISDPLENLGKTKSDGVDVSFTFRMPKTDIGKFVFTLDGTYLNKYDYQTERDGAFVSNVGRYVDNNPTFRWQHNAAVNWSQGVWGATLSNTYKSGYVDQNQFNGKDQDVSSYSLWNLSGSYTGFKHITLTLGVKNLFDKDPPFTNQGTVFQKGYDPRFSDPVGRAYYLRASYAF
jgi:iron complex outermembrane receptor protein